jgi:hypothetical protein
MALPGPADTEQAERLVLWVLAELLELLADNERVIPSRRRDGLSLNGGFML